MNQNHQNDGIYNYPQQFWVYLIVMTILFSVPLCLLYGKNPIAAVLIIATYGTVNLISCLLSPYNIKRLGSLTWIFGGIAYILDLLLIDLFSLTGSEPYAFVVSQIYLFPIGALASAVICIAGGSLLKSSLKNESKEIL